MEAHPYNKLYLAGAMKNLATAFDYAINTCKVDPDSFANLFVTSGIATLFEGGNPSIIAGKSGIELSQEIFRRVKLKGLFLEPIRSFKRSPEYWAGYVLAAYQWETNRRFVKIFSRIPLKEIILMYPLYHEMDASKFIESMEKRFKEASTETKLRAIRKDRGISQSELSMLSGVSLHSIQLYEQQVNDIDKAQVQTLYKLAKTLNCSIEDLLENPEVSQ